MNVHRRTGARLPLPDKCCFTRRSYFSTEASSLEDGAY